MIISFSVSNFRSFAEETTFNMVASKRFQGHHESHLVPIPDSGEHLLKAGVIYGANGAGKSNLFRALTYFKRMVTHGPSSESDTGRDPFRLGKMNGEPSTFDLIFMIETKVYRYGFKVLDDRISEEWLAQVVGNKENTLFERITTADGSVEIQSSYSKKVGGKLAALVTVGGRKNHTFLYTLRTTLDHTQRDDIFQSIILWFQFNLTLISPDAAFRSLGRYLLNEDSFMDFAGNFLQAASTGVSRLAVKHRQLSEDEVRELLPDKVASDLIEGNRTVATTRDGNEVAIDPNGQKTFYLFNINSEHDTAGGSSISFDLRDESDGTQRLLNLMPVLQRLKEGPGVFFIDEIDRSMHPQLVWKFVEFFLTSCPGAHRQLLVTTHESNLLDLELLRRDEIWFAEKNREGASQLYSLVDFKVRKDHSIQKHYLRGRFGAIPYLGDMDRLIEKTEAHA